MEVPVPENLLLLLKCSKCDGLLSRMPVYLCTDGGGLCNACHLAEPSIAATRNTHYEAAASLLLFPCKYQDEGCTVKVPFTDPSEHEDVCVKRQYVCPILGSSACDWFGTANLIQDHCQQQHPDRVLNHPAKFIHDITKSSSHTFLLPAFKLLFLLFTKVCVKTGNIYYSIRYLGSPSKINKLKYTVNITSNDETLIKKGEVAPQGCLAIQEDSSLILNINSLLSIFPGFSDTIFTVTLEQIMTTVKCCKCNILITVKEYCDSEGWKCIFCAPAKSACDKKGNGCTFNSFAAKCGKHGRFFCTYKDYCFICNTSLSSNVLTHFAKSHYPSKYESGTAVRANITHRTVHGYFINSVAGTALCKYEYEWKKSYLDIKIYTDLSNDNLDNFSCTVKIILSATKQNRIYNLDACYNVEPDWYVRVTKDDFTNNWSDTFDICVTIAKKIK